jgi:hypothetical protein
VTDVRGFQGDDYRYELILRRPQPGFVASIKDAANKEGVTSVAPGSGKRISVIVDRIDGFNGPVRVDITNLPTGFYATSPLLVEAGHRAAQGVLFAHPDALDPSEASAAAITITETATIGGGANIAGREISRPVKGFGKLKLAAKPKIIVRLATMTESPRVPSGDGRSLVFPQPAAALPTA